MYQDGDLTLTDLVRVHESPAWGPSRSERPLNDLGTSSE
jgi:hypothetical protein